MWSSKEGELPEPPGVGLKKAEKLSSKLRKMAKTNSVDEIYIATDPDREGEFIAWRLKKKSSVIMIRSIVFRLMKLLIQQYKKQ